MTTDRAGPEGTIGIAVDQGRKGGDHTAVSLHYVMPERFFIIPKGPHLIEWSVISDPTSWDIGETGRATCGQPDETG